MVIYLHCFRQCAIQHGRGLSAVLSTAEKRESPPALPSVQRAVVLQGEGEPLHLHSVLLGGPRCFVKGKAITFMEMWNITGMLLIRFHAKSCCVKIQRAMVLLV